MAHNSNINPFLLPAILALAACTYQGSPAPQDLRLEAVSLTAPRDEFPMPDSTLLTLPSSLRIEFSTATDLASVAGNTQRNAFVLVSRCLSAGVERTASLTGFGFEPRKAELRSSPGASARWLYGYNLSLADTPRLGGTARLAYDLRQNPTELCLELRLGRFPISIATSNTVRIPAAAIRAALAGASE